MKEFFNKQVAKATDFLKSLWAKFVAFVPGGTISIVCFVLDIVAFTSGGGILFAGVVSGLGLCLSIAFILMAMPTNLQDMFIRFIAGQGWITDLVLTVLLTWYGFQAGAVLGTVLLFTGLHLSMFNAVLRSLHFMRHPEARAAHCAV